MKRKPYAKQELAMLYFPDTDPKTATNHLMRWLNRSPALLEKLKDMHYRRSDKFFTPRQVDLVVDFLGEP